MNQGTLYIISAPSGAGKTSLLKKLLPQVNHLMVSVSHTTREPREGEQEGIAYHFTSVEKFITMVNQGDFFESAQVFGHYYGTSQSEVDKNLALGTDVILEIDWQGAQQIRNLRPDSCTIFIMPPSITALRTRLQQRGKDSDSVIDTRMQAAVNEMSHYAEYDYLVINDDFSIAVEQLKMIILSHRLRMNYQPNTHQILLTELLA